MIEFKNGDKVRSLNVDELESMGCDKLTQGMWGKGDEAPLLKSEIDVSGAVIDDDIVSDWVFVEEPNGTVHEIVKWALVRDDPVGENEYKIGDRVKLVGCDKRTGGMNGEGEMDGITVTLRDSDHNFYDFKGIADGGDTWGINVEMIECHYDESTNKAGAKATKNDIKDNKAPLDFLRLDAIEGACRVFRFGAEKYEKDNYLLGMEESRLTAAAMRHILQYQGGEFVDSESGLSHVDHAMCCLMMLKSTQALGTSIKDIKEK